MNPRLSPSAATPGEPADTSAALRSLIRKARGVFGRPLRIERTQGTLRVVLEDDSSAPVGDAERNPKVTAPRTQAVLMATDLRDLFDRCSRSRAVLPHLATLEHELNQRGMPVFEELPLRVLQRAAAQLEGLAQEPVLEGIALLQARLDVSIVAREENAQAQQRKPIAPPSFLMDEKMQVSEASMTDFMLAGGDPSGGQSEPGDPRPR